MKAKDRKGYRFSIKAKTIASILVVGSIPALLGLGLIYFKGTSELRKAIGANFEGLAKETARKVDLIVGREIERLREASQSSLVREAVKKANQGYRGLSKKAVEERISDHEKKWGSIQESISGQKLFLGLDEPIPLQDFLRPATENPAYLTYLITDEKGALITGTSRYADYRNAEKMWWQAAYRLRGEQPYISDLYFHTKANIYAIDIAMAITDEEFQEPIGILKIEYNVQEFLKPSIHPIRFGKTGHAMLIDSAGDVIICPILPTGNHVPDITLVSAVTSFQPGWVIAANDAHGGTNSLVGFAPLEGYNDLVTSVGGKRWHSFIRQDPKELYVPIHNLLGWIALSGILGIGVLSVLGFYVANRMVTPIRRLQEATRQIAEGKHDRPLDIRTGDEIEQLAHALDEMDFKIKEKTKELKETQDKLIQSERLASMGQVAAGIGHELRNPLSVIKNATYFLRLKIKDDPKLVKHLEIMDREIGVSEKIIDDLLNFTQSKELVTTLVDVHQLLDEVLSVIAVPSGIELDRDFDLQLKPVGMDHDQMRRVVVNIVSNALQAMENGGRLKMKTRKEDGWVVIELADTGSGISPENLEKLFRPFFTTKAKGIGLGLAVSKKIIDQHKGKISVRSELRKGTTFSISLPFRSKEDR